MDKTQFQEKISSLLYQATQRPLDNDELQEFNSLMDTTPQLDSTLGTVYTSIESGKVCAQLVVTQSHIQPWGIANGGVYAALGESTASLAGFVAAGARKAVMGVNNATDFLRPSVPGDIIQSEALPIFLGNTQQLWEITHTNIATGKVSAITRLRTVVR